MSSYKTKNYKAGVKLDAKIVSLQSEVFQNAFLFAYIVLSSTIRSAEKHKSAKSQHQKKG